MKNTCRATVAYLLLCHLLLAYNNMIDAFAPTTLSTGIHHPISSTSSSYPYNKHTQLYGGIGIAKTYSWKEEQYEIELRIKVPKETTVRDIHYKPRSKSIHLAIGNKVLLDGSREMRGMIDLDGTFWSIVDSEDHDDDDGRDVVITIEKMILPPKDPFEVVEFDWNGIYPNDEDEIIERKYDVPEELDVREYAKSLGVDIDNINMTLVDKNMFSSGLNMTRNTLEELTKAGYVKEVTRQGDGSEFLMDETVRGSSSSSSSGGSSSGGIGGVGTVPFYPLGENVGREEMEEAGIQMDGGTTSSSSSLKSNPYMNKDSSWFQTMPVEEARTDEDVALDSSKIPKEKEQEEGEKENVSSVVKEKKKMSDPIDLLTVSKLKEVLKREGLKTSGTKKELQERLKEHVKSIMNKKDWQ